MLIGPKILFGHRIPEGSCFGSGTKTIEGLIVRISFPEVEDITRCNCFRLSQHHTYPHAFSRCRVNEHETLIVDILVLVALARFS